MSKRWLVGCAVAGYVAACASAADFRVPPADVPPGAAPAAPAAVDLDTLDLARLVDQDAMTALALKDEDFYVDALAASFGGDPLKAFEWVRTRVQYQPYAGVLRGPQRTLVARAGNAADRALLLAALLKELGVKARFATAKLDDAAADAVVETAFGPTSTSMAAPRGEAIEAVAARAARDYALLRAQLSAEADGAADSSMAAAREAARAHVWVEAEIDGAWTALDPAAGKAGRTLASATGTADTLPDSAYQTVTFRVEASSLADGAVSTAVVLDVTAKAADISAAAIFLAFIEDPQEAGLGGAIRGAVGGKARYVPVLWIEGEPHVGEAIAGLVGAARENAAADFFGGDSEAAPELARLELTIETAGGGAGQASATRTILDRAPGVTTLAADTPLADMPMAQGLAGPTAQIHNIWVSTGPLDLKNAYALRALALSEVVLTYSDPEKTEGLSPADLLWPVAAFNATLPMAMENSALPGMNTRSDVKTFTGRPRVTVVSSGPADGPDGAAYRLSEIDLKLGGATVLARGGHAREAFETRLWVGVVEAAMESEFGRRSTGLIFDAATTVVTSASLAADAPLVRLGTGGDTLPDGAPRNARAAADAGHALFAPAGAMAAWWDVDPATGETRPMLGPDLGGFRSYGGYRPGPSNHLNSSYTRQRSGLSANGGGNVTHISADGRRSIDYGPNGRIARAGGGGPPPNRCGGGSEYMIIVGCVSLPAGWALREAYAVVLTEIVLAAAATIMQL